MIRNDPLTFLFIGLLSLVIGGLDFFSGLTVLYPILLGNGILGIGFGLGLAEGAE